MPLPAGSYRRSWSGHSIFSSRNSRNADSAKPSALLRGRHRRVNVRARATCRGPYAVRCSSGTERNAHLSMTPADAVNRGHSSSSITSKPARLAEAMTPRTFGSAAEHTMALRPSVTSGAHSSGVNHLGIQRTAGPPCARNRGEAMGGAGSAARDHPSRGDLDVDLNVPHRKSERAVGARRSTWARPHAGSGGRGTAWSS